MRGRRIALVLPGSRALAHPEDHQEGGVPALAVAPDVMAGLDLRPGQQIPLSFGQRTVAVAVASAQDLPPGTVAPSQEAATRLLLPQVPTAGLFRGPQGLRLGPLVALQISSQKLENLLAGQEDTDYRRYQRYAEELAAVLCFFRVQDVDLTRAEVRAYQLSPSGWQPQLLPLPRVVYDRCFGPDGRAESRKMRQVADRAGITVVNRPINVPKLTVYTLVEGDPNLRPLLPVTLPLSRENLLMMAAHFPVLYLKPDNLHKGKGIFRLERRSRGWAIRPSDSGGVPGPPGIPGPVEAVLDLLPPGRPYLIQEGIPLATYLGNPYDFRALVQKDAGGCWQVTGLVARIAPEEGVVTSPRSARQVASAERVLVHSFGRRGREILEELTASAVRIARCIDAHLGPCGELGLDLGVTRAGAIQLLEVNGKPLGGLGHRPLGRGRQRGDQH
ncbi:MAG: YheC/YheD family protein, partial [Firmicutes bacterium]|nr:YheC/YheD family protein [Bacillota bacterium]